MSILDEFPDNGYGRSFRKPAPKAKGVSSGPPCPTCGSRNTMVIDSRPIENGQRRRRRCMDLDSCARWNTWETNVDPELMKAPDLSDLNKNRVLRLMETSAALAKSLKLNL